MNVSIKLSKAKTAELAGEFLGTFFFMFVLFISPLAIRSQEPLLVGFIYMVLVFVFMGLSRAHFNPIFTFGDFMLTVYEAIRTKDYSKLREEGGRFVAYFLVQLVAGLIAFALVYRLRNIFADFQLVAAGYGGQQDTKAQLMGSTVLGTKFDAPFAKLAFVLEMFFSMALVVFYHFTSAMRRNIIPFVLGVAIFGFMVLSKDVSGGSFNPVHSIVPAIASWFDPQMVFGAEYRNTAWLYIVAPLLGTMLGSLVFYLMNWLKPVVADKKSV